MGTPNTPTVKRLFALSGNICAFPLCTVPLVDEVSGKVTGRIRHIKGGQPGGPRYDSNQTEDERHGFENLVLMCPIHHDVIDSDLESYTVERLSQIKFQHEQAQKVSTTPDDKVAHFLIQAMTSNEVLNGSVLLPNSQAGGQIAHQITNLLLSHDKSFDIEQVMQQRREAHDIQIFQQADLILSEQRLKNGLGNILSDHSYIWSFRSSCKQVSDFLEQEGNQYLDPSIAKQSFEFISNLDTLFEFLTYNFFPYPRNQPDEDTRLCLYPDLCIDRAGSGDYKEVALYDRKSNELEQLVKNVKLAYDAYRKVIKEALII